MRPVFSSVILLGLMLIPACGSQQTTAPHAGPVATSISATPAEFVRGQTTTVTVSVTNHGATAVDLSFSSGCQLAFDIRSANGTRLGPGGYVCTDSPTINPSDPVPVKVRGPMR
jgi:hypothetical protein